jgi:MFS family permease
MNARARWRLAVMMALVYAVQGSFWPLLAVHLKDLGISGRERGWIFATMAIGSMAMPLGAGQLVDRFMATQRLLALIYAVGTAFLVILALGLTSQAVAVFVLFLIYWMLTAPASGLSTALALRNLPRPSEQFGGIRLWGTAGWAAAGWLVSWVMTYSGSSRSGQGAFEAFWVAAVLSLLLAGFSLTLPNTPPLAVHDRNSSGLRDALGLLRQGEVVAFLVTAFGVCLTTPFVYQVMPTYLESRGLPRPWISTSMTLGQIPEIASLAAMPWLLRRMGYKGTLALGIAAWSARYASLAIDPPLWVAVAGIPLHGVAIACFSVGGQIYIDSKSPAHRRASAQSMLMVVTSGAGMLVGSLLAGEIVGRHPGNAATVFVFPCVINLTLLIYFCAGFRPKTTIAEWVGAVGTVHPSKNDAIRGSVFCVGNLVTESADG